MSYLCNFLQITQNIPDKQNKVDWYLSLYTLKLVQFWETKGICDDILLLLLIVKILYFRYQSADVGNFLSLPLLESQYHYQTSIEESVVVIYDTKKSARGFLTLKAYRLTPQVIIFLLLHNQIWCSFTEVNRELGKYGLLYEKKFNIFKKRFNTSMHFYIYALRYWTFFNSLPLYRMLKDCLQGKNALDVMMFSLKFLYLMSIFDRVYKQSMNKSKQICIYK